MTSGSEAFKARLGDSHLADQISFGTPKGPGWMYISDLTAPEAGPLRDLLETIGERAGTSDPKIIAAAFAARLGWSSVIGILPCLLTGGVPDLTPDNVHLKFGSHTLFEATALARLEWHNMPIPAATHDGVALLTAKQLDRALPLLSENLHLYTQPIVEALHHHTRFSKRGIWGQVYAGWGSVFAAVAGHYAQAEDALPLIENFFKLPVVDPGMAPRFYALRHLDRAHVFHKRASCCLFYRLPQGSLCASCPLETSDNRYARNKRSLEKPPSSDA